MVSQECCGKYGPSIQRYREDALSPSTHNETNINYPHQQTGLGSQTEFLFKWSHYLDLTESLV